MTKVFSIDKSEIELLLPLFKDNRYDVVVMKSVLEGNSGKAFADSKINPSVARLDSGAYTILSGDASSAAALDIIRHSPINVVTPENEGWKKLIISEYKEKISYQPFYRFDYSSLSRDRLFSLSKNYNHSFTIKRINKDLAKQLLNDINNNYFFEHFSSIDDFVDRGIGYCAIHNNKIVSAATSMAVAKGLINIEIETKQEYRNNSLGTAVSSNLLLYCLENNIEPQWLAANVISENLAIKLGYIKTEFYQTMIIN